jgi:hypothetical protein
VLLVRRSESTVGEHVVPLMRAAWSCVGTLGLALVVGCTPGKTPDPVAEEVAPRTEARSPVPVEQEPRWRDVPGRAATLEDLLVGACDTPGEPALAIPKRGRPEPGTALWLVGPAGVVSARAGELSPRCPKRAACPPRYITLEIDGDPPCPDPFYTDAPFEEPASDLFLAVPLGVRPPHVPAQWVEAHVFDGYCPILADELTGGPQDTSNYDDSGWYGHSAANAFAPELDGAPRRIHTLVAEEHAPIHVIAATLGDRGADGFLWILAREDRSGWTRLAGRERHPRHKASWVHMAEHACWAPFYDMPAPAWIFQLAPGAGTYLLTSEDRKNATLAPAIWELGPTEAKPVMRFAYALPTAYF